MLTGIGYDVHRLEEGEDLVLGGVEIDYKVGLLGHSDADVLLHAVADALLGAMGEGDIGRHFPDDDPQYKGVSSLILLEEVYKLVKEKDLKLNNIDAVIIAQKPKLAPYIKIMEKNIAKVLQLDLNRVNLKATTTERLGFVGAGEGIAAQAVASIEGV
ncbi:2-C-methyl-D-erythritol 2,4-cyclodiphosphate synthase [Halanaerobacter jeridensis]|uniref:2-C-methyl-D-erythritol 2,4-cyclodiphosphate synthase n=1 Tax=Halanaerobacter jeridensis TaxID=706427 RepID=A0A939BQ92_9FIRM|nr:2-C-methyl-D-erythritol 2,4-cyclodiphosphate synthase [Halanaerobacter jeridensis]MBM7557858.1 2-C-methyl-D-erythritol 2,4-cyclodiphosphate synthase [Halanaerobacter jeridensis]